MSQVIRIVKLFPLLFSRDIFWPILLIFDLLLDHFTETRLWDWLTQLSCSQSSIGGICQHDAMTPDRSKFLDFLVLKVSVTVINH